MTLPKQPRRSRIETVMEHIRSRVVQSGLSFGSRLPSVRQCAQTLGTSKSTVVEAYERLVAEGDISSRKGSGFFVAGARRPRTLAMAQDTTEPEINPLWMIRQSLEAHPSIPTPGCGWLPDSWMPRDSVRKSIRAEARDAEHSVVSYGQPLGFAPLRSHISSKLADREIFATPEQVLLTDSGTHAIDLLCRFFVSTGDTVLVDDPCYFNFLNILRAHGATIVGVPYTPWGPDLKAFAKAAAEHRPRLYLTTSSIHNPTGATPSSFVQHQLLELIHAHDMTLIEDDVFGAFEPESIVRAAALDGLRRVVYVGSYSKTVSASIRCGFISAKPDWIAGFTDLKLATTFGSNEINARVLYRVLIDGTYRRHMEATKTRLVGARALVVKKLLTAGLKLWTEPRGGLFLWAQLPEDLDAVDVCRRAARRGVLLAPGDLFSVSRAAKSFLRFNVAQCNAPQVFPILRAAMRDPG